MTINGHTTVYIRQSTSSVSPEGCWERFSWTAAITLLMLHIMAALSLARLALEMRVESLVHQPEL